MTITFQLKNTDNPDDRTYRREMWEMKKYKDEYEKQAADFLKRNGAKMTISLKDGYAPLTGGRLYRVRIDRDHKTWSFDFSDSVYNMRHGKRPTKYDVLACIEKYQPDPDFIEFGKEYGYDIDSWQDVKRVQRIHKAVQKEYNNVIRIFGDVIDELAEIQ